MFKKSVHMLGIGGSAMSGLAGLISNKKWKVTGSDSALPYPPAKDILEKCGIKVMAPYSPQNLPKKLSYCVIGNVIRKTNPEAIAATESGVKLLSMPQALWKWFMKKKKRIVVAGTHGKSTTTGMLVYVLDRLGLDPGALVGGVLQNYGTNYRYGNGDYFVVEGDEYDTAYFDKEPKFMHYKPDFLVLTNIEYDHADIFPDLETILEWFRKLVAEVPENGIIIAPAEDENVAKILDAAKAKVVTYGLETGDVIPDYPKFSEKGTEFILTKDSWSIGEFQTSMIGRHNLRNTMAVMALLTELELYYDALPMAMQEYQGTRRRQEYIGKCNGAPVYDDFAHHPTAVIETILAFRQAFAGKRIITLFEAESNTSRRKVFQNEFVKAFSQADEVYFIPALKKADNLAENEKLDINKVVEDIRANGIKAEMFPDVEALAKHVKAIADANSLVLLMSGRDFRGIQKLLITDK